ncbi:alpha-galactosidase [Enterococcus sp. HY326]|uniref:alpha-galactosidase n=1 Tax=Enterococcus sp. HY326 TaxID=2971265 RepID=UPI00223F8653|nr:alpha-galactosidase [Enterococcus sp. HY326]
MKSPKGWNSWDSYGASVTEAEVKQNAVWLQENLLEFGWDYVVVDIQWYEPTADSSLYHNFAHLTMDQFGRLQPAVNRFPSAAGEKGFKPLSDFVHDLGLKFGIHIMRGIPREAVHQHLPIFGIDKTADQIAQNNICPWNADMYGVDVSQPAGQAYYDNLIQMYADWGVDFIKVDDIADSKIYHGAHKEEIAALAQAIKKCGREIVLSLSPGPAHLEDGSFLQQHANMWHLTDDFWDNWPQLYQMFEKCEQWAPLIANGSYPDCDMLPLGHIGIRSVDGSGGNRQSNFTPAEQQTMMTLWGIFQSPLMFGGELTDMNEMTYRLLTNKDYLKMHESLNYQRQIFRENEWVIWFGKSADTEYYAIFNLADEERQLPDDLLSVYFSGTNYFDIWQGATWQSGKLPAHGAALLRKEN